MKQIPIDPKLTAFMIARIRADEGELADDRRLFLDPYAHLFVDPAANAAQVFANTAFFREQVRLRTRFIDDCVRQALAAGVRWIVLVGAGFDTRALRLPEIAAASARVIEVDHAEQVAEKCARFAQAGVDLPEHLDFAKADLESPDLPSLLAQTLAQLPLQAAVLWVWEGLVGYLSAQAVVALAKASFDLSGPGSLLVVNHFVPVWTGAALADALTRAGWAVRPGPSFEELHRRWIGLPVPTGSEQFAFALARY